MSKNNGKEKLISAIAKLIPEALGTGSTMKSHNTDIFHTSINILADNSLRARKGTTGSWLGTSQNQFQKAQEPKPATKPTYACQCCQDIIDLSHEYTESTTLHGLKYVGNNELHLCERFFWFITFLLGILGAGYYISILYSKWTDTPMIVSLSPTPTLLESIPFPALTICNMNGARKSIADPIMNNQNTGKAAMIEKKIVNDLCGGPKEDYKDIKGNWTTLQKVLIRVSQPCHDMLVACKWGNNFYSCLDLFNPELTDEGMCCSFNKVKRNFIYRNAREVLGLMNYTFPYPGIDWNPEDGYPPGTNIDTNPWRAWSTGRSNGLTIVLDAQVYEYYCSSTASIGFKAMLHNPVEAPKISDLGFFINPGVETRVEINPRISKSAPNLVNIPLEKRLCLFQDEKLLRFYRTYTQRNCQLECQSNFTLNQCNCVPFYLPKNADNRICGTGDDDCVDEAKALMETEQQLKLVNVSSDESSTMQCSCLPACSNIDYTRQMSTSKLEDSFGVKPEYLSDRDPAYFKTNMAVVHFFFVESIFTGFEKGEIFGFTEFLSNTGGLLGLFLGFSIMSAAEILYYLSLRALCSWWRGRNRILHFPRLKNHNHPLPFTR